MSSRAAALLIAAAGLLSGCGMFNSDRQDVLGQNDPDYAKRTNDPYHTDPAYSANPDLTGTRYSDVGTKNQSLISSIFGKDANDKSEGGAGGTGVGVNSYLWRATLDTVSFMPLSSADPFGGVIITDWYSPPDQAGERFKVNIFILGRELRADGVRASVFRQKRDAGGQWTDAAVDQATGTDLENAILTRARQMRLSTTAAK
ncbi:MAG TPA: DUF3576 domain-containing protein [Stellaceae bacterium]|nr:DUF3576 domain-containing protein [Stellaceae bacterium]